MELGLYIVSLWVKLELWDYEIDLSHGTYLKVVFKPCHCTSTSLSFSHNGIEVKIAQP